MGRARIPTTLAATLAGLLLAMPAAAEDADVPGVPPAPSFFAFPDDPAASDFLRANLVFVFYHEVAHALIDVLDLPVLGREEDAADALSAWLIDLLWEDESAAALTADAATGFLLYAEEAEAAGEEPPWWGSHSLDLQRHYTLICLLYGADPGTREGFADDHDLPEERRESCPEEFQMAAATIEDALEGLPPQDGRSAFRFLGPPGRDDLTRLLAEEVEALNGAFGLPARIDVKVERCGEANAFYDPRARMVTICREYAADLLRLWRTGRAE